MSGNEENHKPSQAMQFPRCSNHKLLTVHTCGSLHSMATWQAQPRSVVSEMALVKVVGP